MPSHQQSQSSLSAAAAAAAAAVFSNRSFIDDDSNPPSYQSIYPTGIATMLSGGAAADEMKDPKPTTSSSANNGATAAAAAAASGMSNIVASLFQNESTFSQISEPIITYDQLYGNANAAVATQLPSTVLIQPHLRNHHHYLHHRPRLPTQPPHEETLNYRVRKQFNDIFTKAYLLKHFIFISASSMMIILFQIILINNQSVLSHLAAGLWCGLANLFTLLITIITLRYAKVWLLIISIILHFMCLTVSLGSFVVINSVAASRYGSCVTTSSSSSSSSSSGVYNSFFDQIIYEQQQQPQLVDKSGSASNCLGTNLKYANIAMIILGATCMVMFVSFFIKLVAAFNNIHSTRESC